MPVTLDPDAATVYKIYLDSGRPAYETLTPQEARGLYLKGCVTASPEPPELQSIAPLAIPAPHGTIPARLYIPKALRRKAGLAPALVFFHGGGWVIGDLDSHDAACRKLAHEGELILIAVDYRLAPEHKFPSAVDDAIAATRWIAANARELGIDGSRLSVGGDSAGGNLAAVVALSAREDNGPPLAGQALIYPATDFSMSHASHNEPETSVLLTHSVIRWFRDHYLGGAADGLAPGNVLAVYEAGEVIPDTANKGFLNTMSRLTAQKVKLPDERTGTFMVFKTFDHLSYGLIMEATNVIRVADRVENP